MKTVAWAVTTASGLTREEAVLRVRAQAQESKFVERFCNLFYGYQRSFSCSDY
jgi:hypothetical protein